MQMPLIYCISVVNFQNSLTDQLPQRLGYYNGSVYIFNSNYTVYFSRLNSSLLICDLNAW